MKHLVLPIALLTLSHADKAFAQGIIVNEISQGSSGTKEFVELLVVGSGTQTTGTVDLRDWIIDDNNGAFKLSDGTAPGIASGHGRFAPNDTMAAVPIGALIVIYNVADVNAIWNFVQTDSSGNHLTHIENNGMVYYIPGTSTLLRACADVPNMIDTSYNYTNSIIPPTIANWNDGFGFTNNGDAIQIRRPDASFYHGFGISTPTQANAFTTFPTFSEVELPSFNGHAGNSAGKVTYLDCGSWYYASSYETGNATISASTTTETPGLPNNPNNANLIAAVQSGMIDYAALINANAACSIILPVDLLHFAATADFRKVHLNWESENKRIQYFEIEKSADQKTWTSVQKIEPKIAQRYDADDAFPYTGTSFYRLKQTDDRSNISYSKIAKVNIEEGTNKATLSPNPAKDILYISNGASMHYALYNSLGLKIKEGYTSSSKQEISLMGLATGLYIVDLFGKNGVHQTNKFWKE
jgi:hypothetical protein